MKIKSRQKVLGNFSDEFVRSNTTQNVVVDYAIELLRRDSNIYEVLELVMKTFVEKDKEQLELIKQLLEKCHIPLMYLAEKEE